DELIALVDREIPARADVQHRLVRLDLGEELEAATEPRVEPIRSREQRDGREENLAQVAGRGADQTDVAGREAVQAVEDGRVVRDERRLSAAARAARSEDRADRRHEDQR